MKRYEVWRGDLFLGIFYEDEIAYLLEDDPTITIKSLDD